jgi:hypothetical protein
VWSAPCRKRRAAWASWFGLKTKVVVSPGLAIKPVASGFPVWASKPVVTVWSSKLSGLQFVGYATKLMEDEGDVRHMSRSTSLLHLEASLAKVSQSGIKTSGGTAQMEHVTSSWSLCGVQAEDGRVNATGCIRLFYPNFVIFIILDPRGILVV